MDLRFRSRFYRDLNIKNPKLQQEVYIIIQKVKSAASAEKIPNLKKLRKYRVHYRIRVNDDYRIGAVIRGKTIWFACLLSRKSIYKKFP